MGDQVPQNITDARNNANNLTAQANAFTSALPTVGDTLKQKVSQLFDENKDILNNFSNSLGGLISAPNQGNQMFGNVNNPFTRQGLISQFIGDASVAPTTYAGLLGQRIGRQSDLVNAGTNAFTAQATAAQNSADLAQKQASDLWDQWLQLQQLQLAKQQAAAAAAQPDLSGLLDILGGNTNQNAAAPNYNDVFKAITAVGDKNTYVDSNEQSLAYNKLRDMGYSPADAQNLLTTVLNNKIGGYQNYTAPPQTYNGSTLPGLNLSGIANGQGGGLTGGTGTIALPANFKF